MDPTDPGVNPPINPDLLAAFRTAPRTGGPGPGGRRGPATAGTAAAGAPPGPDRSVVGRRTPARFAVVDALDADGLLPAIYFIFSRAGCEGAVQQCLTAGCA